MGLQGHHPCRRRRLLLRSAAACVLGGWAGHAWAGGLPADAFEPDDPDGAATREGYRLHADFDATAAVWLSHDLGHEALSAGLVAALGPHVPLVFMVRDEHAEQVAREAFARRGVLLGQPPHKPVRFVHEPMANFFMRDMAVFTATPGGRLGVVDFRWTQYGVPAWCARRWAGEPQHVAHCSVNADFSREEADRVIARHAGARLHPSSIAIEGGGFETNGRGLLIANEALYRSRNQGASRQAMETALLRLPGLRKVIWLPEGLAEDPHLRATITGPYVAWGSGGHTDEFVRFADARTVLLAWPDEADVARHPVARLTRARMQRNLDILSRAGDAEGRPLRVLKVPMPRPIERRVVLAEGGDSGASRDWRADVFVRGEQRRAGQVLTQLATASYLNFVVANGVVVLPDYLPHGTPGARQRQVMRVFEQAFPGREIRSVDAITANWVGGGLHCATLNQA